MPNSLTYNFLRVWLFCFYVKFVSSKFSIGNYVALDITHLVNEDSVYWNGSFSLQPLRRSVSPFYAASNTFSNPEHGGTHIDAPYHFNPYGRKVGDIPLQDIFMVEGVIIDVSHKTTFNPEYQLTMRDVKDWERRYGPLPDRCVVMVNFGWAEKYTNRTAFLGIRNSNDLDRHFPGVGGSAAQYLVATRKVLGVGVDSPALDASGGDIAHQILLGADLFALEILALDRICGVPPRGFRLVILPMRIEQGTGAPAHVVIVMNPNDYNPGAYTSKYSRKLPATDVIVNIVH